MADTPLRPLEDIEREAKAATTSDTVATETQLCPTAHLGRDGYVGEHRAQCTCDGPNHHADASEVSRLRSQLAEVEQQRDELSRALGKERLYRETMSDSLVDEKHYHVTTKRELAAAEIRVREMEAENLRMRQLFQATHGVHWSWVDKADRASKRVAELEAKMVRVESENYADLMEQMEAAWGSFDVSHAEWSAFMASRVVHKPTASLRKRVAELEAERADLAVEMFRAKDSEARAHVSLAAYAVHNKHLCDLILDLEAQLAEVQARGGGG